MNGDEIDRGGSQDLAKDRNGKRTTRADRSPGDRPATERDYRQVAVKLPRATLAIIEREAASCGLKRSVFLHTLLLHHLGRLRLERRSGAPSYRFNTEDWTVTERFIWHQNREINKAFDALRLRLGNIRPHAWIVLAINEWVGLPTVSSEHGPTADPTRG